MVAEHPGFLADILANPGDDLPRLVYADYLDEHGNSERAKFIRCGVLTDYECDFSGTQLNQWFPGTHVKGARFIIRRGFIDEVRLTLAEFIGEACQRCDGGAALTTREWFSAHPSCSACRGTGHTSSLARALFADHPITIVRFTNREPQDFHSEPLLGGQTHWDDGTPYHERLFGWYRCSSRRQDRPCDIPGPLWDIVIQHPKRIIHNRWADFLELTDANDALSQACVEYGRNLAALPLLLKP
jgi:uncharacterized protein (TIGR02996 family)